MNVEDVFEIAKERNALAEHEVKSLLRDYGIPVPNFMVVNSPEDVESITLKFPVVVKASSPNILHKTDVGAVRLNVKDIEELKTVVKEFKEKFKDAKILIEEMEDKNLEVIVGVINDATFGPAIMFGLGGIFVEVLRDVTFRVVPITRADAEDMLKEIKGAKLLEGFRGIKVDREALVKILLRVSDLAQELEPVIDQLDLNPIFLKESGAVVVDAKMLLRRPK
ncbi:MAG: acetyl-CoA synthetase [Thermoplasmata archaeon]|nr:acetate--CoA ligase family protein [Euryarchaeota archaeon]RLF63927.1 MAG: acetyl-CoA synthetase [Thermoplasmata archaeon]